MNAFMQSNLMSRPRTYCRFLGVSVCALSSIFSFDFKSANAQTAIDVPSSGVTRPIVRHLGNGPIDLNNLPPDVLNCDVCRQRLGLPPLSSPIPSSSIPSSSTVAKPSENVRMLGSPGLMSSSMAAQLSSKDQVVEEFRPPQPQPGAIQLDGIPFEARQQFLQSLNLPAGARIMSANIFDPSKPRTENQPTENVQALPPRNDNTIRTNAEALGAPGIVSTNRVANQKPNASTELQSQLDNAKKELDQATTELNEKAQAVSTQTKKLEETQEQLNDFKSQIAKLENEAASNRKTFADEREGFAKQKATLEEKQKQIQIEIEKRTAQSQAANKEVLTMLEKRTAEVTGLQEKLRAQQVEFAKTRAELESKDKELKAKQAEARKKKKKEPSKDEDK